MANHAAVTVEAHRGLRIRTERSAALGDAVMSCITFPAEFRRLQHHYPIVFQLNHERKEFHALALFGFEPSENLFLKNGRWDARYVPLAIDIQPFLIGLPRDRVGEGKVHIDLDSPRIGDAEGARIFDDLGQPTAFLETISEKLGQLHEGYKRTPAYLEMLQKHGLLEPFVLEVEMRDSSKNRLVGFHTINEDRLRSLNAAALGELHDAGFLMPTFMALASASNFVDLIERRNAAVGDV